MEDQARYIKPLASKRKADLNELRRQRNIVEFELDLLNSNIRRYVARHGSFGAPREIKTHADVLRPK